ncbi:sensor histidine kinase [Auritidibacter ignavus]|uniref:sensor histidine kinase n=1 Tax=Auritidibacter ignavus TaxID=678932 RepID=UPI00244D0199|nr:histidine kinase [Auritidibacter ignavus]WGH83572.1 histidine kinase [Auritidibacter ignavus]
MTGTGSIPSLRHTWITIGYVVVAIGFCFVPGAGIEWFATPRSQVLIGSIATAIALGIVHLFRQKWPTVVVVAGLAVMTAEGLTTGTTSVGAILIECDALYSLVIARPTTRSRRLLPMIAAACLSSAVGGLLLANLLAEPLLQMTTLLLAVGVTLWWGITVRAPMTRAEEERERATLIADAVAAKQREALVAERLQISRELHDTISGHLSAITIQAAGALATTTPPTAEELTERLERVRALSLDAMGDMRTLIDVLRTDTSSSLALAQNWSSVDSLIAGARESGTSITLTGDDPATINLDPLVSVTAYYVLREALVNAEKHAPGSDVTIDIRHEDEVLAMTITNGQHRPGRVGAMPSGYGLIGLAERVRLCNGELDIDRSNDTWTLRVCLPLRTGRESQHA